jgi:predicted transcriptional regulator
MSDIVMKYRDKTELIALTVKAVGGDSNASAAHIMYNAFLSYEQMKQYLSISIDAGLITYQELNRRRYGITEKGMRFLHAYNEISELLVGNSTSRSSSYSSSSEAIIMR